MGLDSRRARRHIEPVIARVGSDLVEFDQDGGNEVGRFVGILDRTEFLAFSSPGRDAITRTGDTFKAFSRADGGQLWSATVPLDDMRGFRSYDDVMVAQGKSKVVSLDLATGSERWSRLGFSQLVDHQRTGYVLLRRSAEISVVDAVTGTELGHLAIEESADVPGKHMLTKDVVYVSSRSAFTGYELPSLEELWTTTLPGDDAPDDLQLVDRGVIVQTDQRLYLFD